MADVKISGLPASTVPLAGTEVLPIVQSSTTKKVSIANVTAGRAVSALSFAPTGSALPTNGLFLPAANAVGLSTDSEERLRVFATGGVSIGNTTDPGATNLSVTGALTLGTALSVGNGGTALTSFTANGVLYAPSTNTLATSANLTWNGVAFTAVNAGTTAYIAQSTTNAAGALLRINGLNASGTALIFDQGINIVTANAFELYDRQNSQQIDLYVVGASGYRSLYTNGSERMRIDSSGNLLVGTTAQAVNPTTGVQLNNVAGGTLGYVGIGHANGIAQGNPYATFAYDGTQIGSITQSGTTAVLFNITSDARLKTNIVDAPLGNIDDVKVRSFDWKSDNSHVEYGFIAQELAEIAPYAVHQPQDPEEMMAVDYSKLVPMMIKEIQDLKQRIKTLENK